jgi:gamma-glutamylcyclotransferase (GGCT)/AIG2-like uncharacterized protein YtfP
MRRELACSFLDFKETFILPKYRIRDGLCVFWMPSPSSLRFFPSLQLLWLHFGHYLSTRATLAESGLSDLGEYPGAVLSDAGPTIEGQVFELPDDPEVLKRLDEYEEFDPRNPERSLFIREECSVLLDRGKKVTSWVYSYNRHPGSAASLLNGDFAKSRTQKSR